jgi:predicted TIM-barrel fold metal-dependent hydrolase
METILEPDLLICDPHHHLWTTHTRYVGRYMPEDLRADTGAGHRIEKTVFIECRAGYRSDGPDAFKPVGEVEFVVESEPTGFVAGIVGHVDLREPEAAEVLAMEIEAGKGRYRGIRQISARDASPDVPVSRPFPSGLLGDPSFRTGFAELRKANLSFDAWLYHPQIPELTDLARSYPDVQIICDHLGGRLGVGPYAENREEVRRTWRAALKDLATCENVALKLGGIGMPLVGEECAEWHKDPDKTTSEEIAAAWGDDIRWCIETFGTDRCMFESNFPVDKESFGYVEVWNAFKRITEDASPADKEALFRTTALRVYRI